MAPAPARRPASTADPASARGLLFGLVGGPLAWSAQFALGYGLTGYACFPGDHPVARMIAGLDWARPACLALNVLAALVAAAAGWTGLRTCRATRNAQYRTAFLAACGAMTGFGFLVATLFDTVMILGAPACRG